MIRECHSWEAKEENAIQCRICPHNCVLKSGQKGYCQVRQNVDGCMRLLVYGKCSGLSVDPIEKKPLYHFYPGSDVLSFGTHGCNLGCQFCQNWTLSKRDVSEISLIDAPPEFIALKAKESHCRSVAFTYNEPIIFSEYVEDVSAACRKEHIKSVLVSAGYINPEPRRTLLEHIDAANIDLKAFTDSFYQKYCSGRLQPVLDTLRYIKNKTSIWLEVTTLLINGLNDSREEITAMTAWIKQNLGADVPLHFSAFHGAYQMTDTAPTSFKSLQTARNIARAQGLRYVYIGNVADQEALTTYCHQCQTPLIKRNYFQVDQIHVRQNLCPSCQTACAGVFVD